MGKSQICCGENEQKAGRKKNLNSGHLCSACAHTLFGPKVEVIMIKLFERIIGTMFILLILDKTNVHIQNVKGNCCQKPKLFVLFELVVRKIRKQQQFIQFSKWCKRKIKLQCTTELCNSISNELGG
jgi:hypothetical protein